MDKIVTSVNIFGCDSINFSNFFWKDRKFFVYIFQKMPEFERYVDDKKLLLKYINFVNFICILDKFYTITHVKRVGDELLFWYNSKVVVRLNLNFDYLYKVKLDYKRKYIPQVSVNIITNQANPSPLVRI